MQPLEPLKDARLSQFLRCLSPSRRKSCLRYCWYDLYGCFHISHSLQFNRGTTKIKHAVQKQLEMIAQTEENRNANDSSTADDISQVNIIWFKKRKKKEYIPLILQEFLGRLLYFYWGTFSIYLSLSFQDNIQTEASPSVAVRDEDTPCISLSASSQPVVSSVSHGSVSTATSTVVDLDFPSIDILINQAGTSSGVHARSNLSGVPKVGSQLVFQPLLGTPIAAKTVPSEAQFWILSYCDQYKHLGGHIRLLLCHLQHS